MRRSNRSQLWLLCLGAMAASTLAIGCSAPVRTFADDASSIARHEPSIAQLVEQRRAAERPEPAHDLYPRARYGPTEPSQGPPTADEVRTAKPAPTAPSIEQTEQLGEALAKLVRQGAIDAETQSRLLDSLKQTDPALWPQLLTYFQAAASRKSPAAPPEPQAAVRLASAERAAPKADSKPIPKITAEPAKSAKPREEEPASASDTPASAEAVDPDNTAKPAREAQPAREAKTDDDPKPARKASETQQGEAKSAEAERRSRNETPADESDLNWRQQLQTSIARLEKETQNPPTTHEEIGKHAVLRMLYLAAGRREEALRPIVGIPPAHQDFWSKELYGLAALMDHERNPDTSRRAAEARSHLRGAAARLGELATLQVCNLTCCREVSSYGVYKPFEASEFHAGQELLLYAEIENFKSEHTDRGYHTALKASYQILDERGARVDEKVFALTEEYCQNPRHDFFVRYFIWLPQKIYGGTYTLQLSVEDTLSQKIGQASVQFTIKPQS